MEQRNREGIKSRSQANKERQDRRDNKLRNSQSSISRETSQLELRDDFREKVRQERCVHRTSTSREGQRNQSISKRKKRTVRGRRRKYVYIFVIFLLVLLIVGTVGYYFYEKKYGLSDEEMNLSKYYETVSESDMAVVLNDEVVGNVGKLFDGVPYISYDAVRKMLNSRFYWDLNENLLLYTLADQTIMVNLGESVYTKGPDTVNTDYIIVKTEGADAYIAAEFVQEYTNIEYELFDSPNRLVMRSEWGEYETATIKKDTQVRYKGGVKSEILTHIQAGDKVIVLEMLENWVKVSTQNGMIGYTQLGCLDNQGIEELSREFKEVEYSSISKDYPINMAFHQVTNNNVNNHVLETLANTKGLTTIAPTWFFINSVEGDIVSLANQTYVDYAHQMGIEVWAVLNDFDGSINSAEDTYKALSSTTTRTKIINSVIDEVMKNDIDGINVDIEKVSTDAGPHYIQFLRELSVKCRQNEIVLSVDNYPPKPYNTHFDYKEQGIIADYVVIMSYDEHYGGSLQAGSVSSISYVEEAVKEMLTMVPAEKIINAIPFYTRLWQSTPKTAAEIAESEGTEEADYDMKVTSKTYGMDNAVSIIEDAKEQYDVETKWDDVTKQNYATWMVDNTVYEIWLEDKDSITEKLEIVRINNLAGSAAWKLGFEDPNIWSVIQKYVN